MSTPIELEVAFLVWKDKDGNEQITPAHTFPSGTSMLFQQTAAPVGWTKSTAHNNKALRVTSGTATTGGNSAFNTVFGKTATNNHTLTAAQMPVHRHSTNNTGAHTHNTNSTGAHRHTARGTKWNYNGAFAPSNLGYNSAFSPGNLQISANSTISGMHNNGNHSHNTNNAGGHSHNTNNAGSGHGHSHGIDLRVQYIDVIIATKD